MVQLLILADDLTGCMDTGVQFAKAGIRTRVCLFSDINEAVMGQCDAPVMVIDTESRHLSAVEAARRIMKLTRQAVRAGISYLYKKTDSTLRGNIGSELTAMLECSGTQELIFVPAYPSLGRYTISGCQYVGSLPLHRSSFADDPFHPIQHSEIPKIIAQQSSIRTSSVSWQDLQKAAVPQEGLQVLVVDAATDAELSAIGHTLRETGRLRCLAGCAGFAAVLPKLLNLPRSPLPLVVGGGYRLLVSGSLHPQAKAQCAFAVKACSYHGIPRTAAQLMAAEPSIPLPVESLTLPHNKLLLYAAESRDTVSTDPNVLHANAAAVAAGFGNCVRALTECSAPGSLTVFGGDTLFGILHALQVRWIEPICEIVPGVACSLLHRNHLQIPIISKAGGFGSEDVVSQIDHFLDSRQQTPVHMEVSS